MSSRLLGLVVAPLLAGAVVASDAPRPFQIDRAHSEINFTAYAPLLDAHGFFDSFTVNVAFDPDTVANSTVEILIDPKFINTRAARRDAHLKTCDFFCVDSFPQIAFKSNKVTRVGPDRYNVDGTITMRGVTKPLTIPGRLVFNEGGRARFNGTFKLNRKDFGVNGNGGGGIIDDTVDVAFNFTLGDPAMRRGRGGPGAPPPPASAAPGTPPAAPRGQ